MKAMLYISLGVLWASAGLNIWSMIRNFRLSKMYYAAIERLQEAKERCDDTAQQLNKALDELQKNGVEAALAVFEKEDAE